MFYYRCAVALAITHCATLQPHTTFVNWLTAYTCKESHAYAFNLLFTPNFFVLYIYILI
jgi:hypothetical protein